MKKFGETHRAGRHRINVLLYGSRETREYGVYARWRGDSSIGAGKDSVYVQYTAVLSHECQQGPRDHLVQCNRPAPMSAGSARTPNLFQSSSVIIVFYSII